jgi:drug/metabolite transporter (DMT)-like permease
LACTIIGYLLQLLNILFILGLECISVSLSNAIYHLQTIFTVGLSVWIFQDCFSVAEAFGIVLSTVGVAVIAVPPLLLAFRNVGSFRTSWENGKAFWIRT